MVHLLHTHIVGIDSDGITSLSGPFHHRHRLVNKNRNQNLQYYIVDYKKTYLDHTIISQRGERMSSYIDLPSSNENVDEKAHVLSFRRFPPAQ